MAHPNVERVRVTLEAQGVQAEVVELADSTRTATEAAAAIGTTVAQIAKSLVFLADGAPILVIASGVNRVDTRKVGAHVGAKLTQASADDVKRLTGFPIGGVPPLAHATPPRVFLDRDLMQYAVIWAAAGTPHAVFRTTPDELVRVTGAEVIDVREEPKVKAQS